MGFLLDIRHWRTVTAFEQHLSGYDPRITAPWAQGITYHHTYRPLASQWVGVPSINGLVNTYKNKVPAWDRGPHLFIVHGATNPDHNGIWQFTPLNVPGIHAGACNAHFWGIEVCGDYDKAFWPDPVAQLALGAGAALLRWRGLSLSPETVKGHRDCLNNKSCPGWAVDLEHVRTLLAPLLVPVEPQPVPTLSDSSPIMSAPTCTQAQATAYLTKTTHRNYTSADLSLTIIPGYWSLCLATGVNPAVPLAQLIKEGSLDSFWGARPRRNPAGIGVDGTHSAAKPKDTTGWAFNTDRNQWEKGLSFASWVNGSIEAHVGRLVAWATAPQQRTDAQQKAVEKALSYRPLALGLQGSATKLRHLGKVYNSTGYGWSSPGSDYGQKLAEIMNAMAKQ